MSKPVWNSGVRRTLIAYFAAALGVLPVTTALTDRGWLIDIWIAMLIVLLPALLLRFGREPSALQIWPGMVLLALWLTGRFLNGDAIGGFLPWHGAWNDFNAMLDDLRHTTQTQVAPVHSTPAITLALCLVLALLTALIDLLAVVGRHSALAGLPLLAIYTVSGAVARQWVPWPGFVAAAAGFLLLLTMDSAEDLAGWGHRLHRPATPREAAVRSSAVRRVPGWSWQRLSALSVLSVVVAIALPLVLPAKGSNVLTSLIRSGNGGGSTGVSLDPFAGLKGNLSRGEALDLATVTVTPGLTTQPFYLREAVLSDFEDDGWVQDKSPGRTESLFRTDFGGQPYDRLGSDGPTVNYNATIQIKGLRGAPPVFAVPTDIAGLRNARWSVRDQVLVGEEVEADEVYAMHVAQPNPSEQQVRASYFRFNTANFGAAVQQWTDLPVVPQQVRELTARVTAGAATPYERAKAIYEYFTAPENGFSYSLTTIDGDSGSDLVDFLANKQGFCQQYAAAMGVMLRLADVPARVVLGYTHEVPDEAGTFTVTSADAHAWVEAYFPGVGWLPFDPTPLAGISGGAANELPWAPHRTPSSDSASATSSATSSGSATMQDSSTADATEDESRTVVDAPASPARLPTVLGALLAGLALLAAPALVRLLRRRRRMRAARVAGPEPLWDELADTATDLGYGWSPSRTPRQVADWLGAETAGTATGSLTALARAVEQARYAQDHQWVPSTGRELEKVRDALRAKASRGRRISTRLLPASVLPHWLRPFRRSH